VAEATPFQNSSTAKLIRSRGKTSNPSGAKAHIGAGLDGVAEATPFQNGSPSEGTLQEDQSESFARAYAFPKDYQV
jgi:hypothetical protein